MATAIPGFPNISTSVFNGVSIEPELTTMKKGTSKSWLGEYHWVTIPVTDKNKIHIIGFSMTSVSISW